MRERPCIFRDQLKVIVALLKARITQTETPRNVRAKCRQSFNHRRCSVHYDRNKNDNVKNVDIKFSAHDAFLEYPSSGTLNIKKLESELI